MLQPNIFETVKQSVSPEKAASFYGMKQDRNHKYHCPFHDDRHPSMMIYPDHFHCFGCGKTGDVTALTAELLGLSQLDAARRICVDFNIDVGCCGSSYDPTSYDRNNDTANPAGRVSCTSKSEGIYADASIKRKRTICVLALLRYSRITEQQMKEHAPSPDDDEWSDAFCLAAKRYDRAQYLLDTLIFGTNEEAEELIENCRYELEGILDLTNRFYPITG